jgi:hypothetical protein
MFLNEYFCVNKGLKIDIFALGLHWVTGIPLACNRKKNNKKLFFLLSTRGGALGCGQLTFISIPCAGHAGLLVSRGSDVFFRFSSFFNCFFFCSTCSWNLEHNFSNLSCLITFVVFHSLASVTSMRCRRTA